jgi:NADH:quinone reductase (non-electrogenic)
VNATRPQPHVVILGGGFGGLYAAKALRHAPVRVTLVDRRNHHLFQPLLYQVATAGLNPADIAAPIRSVFRGQRNTAVILAEARSLDVATRRVVLADGVVDYDHLIVATGATHSYFGNDAWAPHAPGLKSLEDALDIRRRVFLAYENAEREGDPARRREWMTFVIIGAGPTGVEMAGALAEISRQALSSSEFHHIDPRSARIILVEGAGRVLPPYPPELSGRAKKQLEHLGVEVWTSARVTGIDERGVSLGEARVAARTVVWAAGVQASPLVRSLGVPLDRAGRVLVTPFLTVPGHDEVYVIGDLVALDQDGRPVPGVCPSAIQEGRHAAANVVRAVQGLPLAAFRYRDKGSFATIGRGAAVGALPGGVGISGFPAWIAWMLIHIFFLIGFRNRALVMFQWAYAYITFRRGARLITYPPGASLGWD